MQDKSAGKCSHGLRLDQLRVKLQLNWAQVAERIGLSESMIFQVKSGKKQLSPKALYRLIAAEKGAGLGVEPSSSPNAPPAPQSDIERLPGDFAQRLRDEASEIMLRAHRLLEMADELEQGNR